MKKATIKRDMIYIFSALAFLSLIFFFKISPILAERNDSKQYSVLTMRQGDIEPSTIIIFNLTGHSAEIWDIEFHPLNNTILASASSDGTVKIWDLQSQSEVLSFSDHNSAVYCLKFNPTGEIIASGSFDNSLLLWNSSTGDIIANLTGHTTPIWSVDFDSKGQLLVSASGGGEIKLWNVSSHENIANFTGHTASIRSVIFDPTDKWIISGSYDKTVKIWDINSEELNSSIDVFTDTISSLDFHPNYSEILVVGSFDSNVSLFNIYSSSKLASIIDHESSIRTVKYSPNGRLLVSGSSDRNLIFYDTFNIDLHTLDIGPKIGKLNSHSSAVLDVAFNSKSEMLASCSSDKNIRLWNITDLDSDGLPNFWEQEWGFNLGSPLEMSEVNWDNDTDSLTTLEEFLIGTSPLNSDTDNDLIDDGFEYRNNLNPLINDAMEDLDNDGMSNLFEYQYNLKFGENDANEDPDNDGMTNILEFQYGLIPNEDDSQEDKDADGMSNIWEIQNNLNPTINDANEDPDSDGLTNIEEYLFSTNPNDADSDNDGWNDGQEVDWGTSPSIFLLNPFTIGIFILILLVMLVGGLFLIIKYSPVIYTDLEKTYNELMSTLPDKWNDFKRIFFGPELGAKTDWVYDLRTGKAIPLILLTEKLGEGALEIPKIAKQELTQKDIEGKALVMRSQMILLENRVPKNNNCQVCMGSIDTIFYFQCEQCKRYVCANDFVELQSVKKADCPNCSGILKLFPFTCPACKLDFVSTIELSKQNRCPLCGYTLPNQASLISNALQEIKPTFSSQITLGEDEDQQKKF